jgi:N-methylhydantoinase B
VHPDGREESLYSKNTNLAMPAGTLVRWEQASGGGYGDPLERDPAAVLRDLEDEFVTIDEARDHYGVAIDPATMTVDVAGTARLRAARAPG